MSIIYHHIISQLVHREKKWDDVDDWDDDGENDGDGDGNAKPSS